MSSVALDSTSGWLGRFLEDSAGVNSGWLAWTSWIAFDKPAYAASRLALYLRSDSLLEEPWSKVEES